MTINAEAKAAAAAAAASALFKSGAAAGGGPRPGSGLFKPFGSRPESSGAESPTSSNNVKEEEKSGAATSVVGPAEPSMDYLEYLKKVAPFLKHTMSHPPTSVRSPSGISSTQQTGSPPLTSTSELISNLYASNFRNMVKSLSSQMPHSESRSSPQQQQQQQQLQQQLFKSRSSGSRNPESGTDLQQQHKSPKPSGNPPDADSSSGALDLSQLHQKDESPMPSRPQSGSQASTAGSGKSSRRKGKAFKIERKMLTSGSGATDHDRDSLNSGPSDDLDCEVKSDGSSGLSSGKELATTTGGTNGDHHTVMDHPGIIPDFETGIGGKSVRLSGSHLCKFCEIAFMDSIMYNIHMGYHGFQNPFLCNKCGNEFEDKVGFFLHIGTHSHR